MPGGTTLEINTSHVLHNLNYFRTQLNPDTKVMVMVKAFAYGFGNPGLSRMLEDASADYLGVAYVREGVALRKAGLSKPIMVMNPHPDLFQLAHGFDLELEIFSLKTLKILDRLCSENASTFNIHLKVETGMNRLGFEREDLTEMMEILSNNDTLQVKGILTHLSSAEMEEEQEFTLHQITEFNEICSEISEKLGIKPLRHILNSAGVVNFTEYQYEMVRVGIGIYGLDRAATNRESPFKTSCTLKSHISQIKVLNKGQTVGYSRAGVVENDGTRIATISMGYADGFSRNLGNGRAKVWIKGQWAPTFGNICMDMFMIDVSGLSVEEGDDVEVFGENQSVEDLAEAANTIPYEIFTSIGERVERVFV